MASAPKRQRRGEPSGRPPGGEANSTGSSGCKSGKRTHYLSAGEPLRVVQDHEHEIRRRHDLAVDRAFGGGGRKLVPPRLHQPRPDEELVAWAHGLAELHLARTQEKRR